MSRLCELTGVKTTVGCNVSHSNRKTKRTYRPNLQYVGFYSQILKSKITLRVCAKSLRTVDLYGGIDQFLLQTTKNISGRALELKKTLAQAVVKKSLNLSAV